MIPRRDMFVQYRAIQGEYFLAKRYDCFKLEGVGKEVWELIDGVRSVQEIANEISQKYSASEEIVFKDVDKFVGKLIEQKLVEV